MNINQRQAYDERQQLLLLVDQKIDRKVGDAAQLSRHVLDLHRQITALEAALADLNARLDQAHGPT